MKILYLTRIAKTTTITIIGQSTRRKNEHKER